MVDIVPNETENQERAQLIFDPALGTPIQGSDANNSVVANNPTSVIVEAMTNDANTTSVILYVKNHKDGIWVVHTTLAKANINQIVDFAVTYNFVKVTRIGTSNVKVFAQYQ